MKLSVKNEFLEKINSFEPLSNLRDRNSRLHKIKKSKAVKCVSSISNNMSNEKLTSKKRDNLKVLVQKVRDNESKKLVK